MALIQFVNKLWFGPGELKRLPRELARLGAKRPLLCTDRGIIAAGLLDQLLAHFPAAHPLAIFADTPPNPTEAAVILALTQFKAEGCDAVVALGGGSAIDLAKAVNLLITHPLPLAQYETARKGLDKIGPSGPLIAIPTTAGTGTEVSVGSMIITDDGRKATISSPYLVPDVAICDPDLTVGLPPFLTAATGMDALTHCIEAVLSPLYNPVADAIGLDGMARAFGAGALERAFRDGQDRDARREMMMAAVQGALAFTKGLGAVHSMSHAAGRISGLNLHHGTLNAVILPEVLAFNAPASAEPMARIAAACELSDASALPDAIRDLNARLGLPASLAQMGVRPEHVTEMTAHCLNDVSTLTNPRPLSAEDFAGLYQNLL